MFLLHATCEAQIPDSLQLPLNYDYNYIDHDTSLSHLKQFFLEGKDSISRPLRILHIGDSHVKSGYFGETFAMLLDTFLRQYTAKVIVHDSDSSAVQIKIMAKNGAMAKTILQSVYSDTIVSNFSPDLVIISLGTNEAYNGLSPDTLACYHEALIEQVFRDAPGCDILITTPGDGLKKYYTKVRVSKKKKRYRKVVHYRTNEYLMDVIEYYKGLPEKMDVAVWDFFPVMGGEESIKDWCNRGFAQKDMIHLTKSGYQLQARLLFEAVTDSLKGMNSEAQ
jgi:lysophospholipase L1-like esterase